MLSEMSFMAYCQTLNLSEAAQEKIRSIRLSEPVRHVQGRGSNVCARYPSRKMGRVIQAESRTVELVAIRCAYEFEGQVLEFWDQPCRIPLQYLARNGRTILVNHTPDFFILRRNEVGWEEWKPEEQLEKLAEKMPHRYQRAEDGSWHCPPGEAYAAEVGFYYRVRTTTAFSPTYQRNVAILEDYLRDNEHRFEAASRQKIVVAVRENCGITLEALKEEFPIDELLNAIATGDIYVDLEAAPLVNVDQVKLFSSPELARNMSTLANKEQRDTWTQLNELQTGAIILWDEQVWQVVNLGLDRVALMLDKPQGHLLEISRKELEKLVAQNRIILPSTASPSTDASLLDMIRHASPQALERATKRVQIVEALLAGQNPQSSYSPRTLRYYKQRYLDAQAMWGTGFIGLLDENYKKGNRVSRMDTASKTQLEQFISESHETFKQKSVLRVYNEYAFASETQGIKAACYTTFARHVKQRSRAEQVRKRQGKRAAYQVGPQNWQLSYDTPRHGDFPWQYGHIDSTQLNVEMVCARTGRVLGRPWLSLVLDAFSRRILAIYISFDPPSYRSCMAVLGECVRRHQRLPQHIIVDNGPEFRSIYFETMLAHYQVTKLSRPEAEPRTGALIERLFRTSETEFVHTLRGNTQIMRLVRQVTKAVNPKNLAIWTLECFYEYFCTWCYEIYDRTLHTTLGQSPREVYLAGLAAMGLRPRRTVPYDEMFRILILPTTNRGQAKVIPGHGIKVNYLYYWCDAFRQPTVEKTLVAVRYDPFNVGIAYAYVNNLWERCISEHYATFQGYTERAIAIATTMLRQQKRQDRQQITVNAHLLTAFLNSVEGQEAVLEQQLKDKAVEQIRMGILGIEPDEVTVLSHAQGTLSDSDTQTRWSMNLDDLDSYGDISL